MQNGRMDVGTILPRWLRVILVLGLFVLAGGGGLYAYRYVSRPTTLTVAAGSFDGDAPQLMSTIAVELGVGAGIGFSQALFRDGVDL